MTQFGTGSFQLSSFLSGVFGDTRKIEALISAGYEVVVFGRGLSGGSILLHFVIFKPEQRCLTDVNENLDEASSSSAWDWAPITGPVNRPWECLLYTGRAPVLLGYGPLLHNKAIDLVVHDGQLEYVSIRYGEWSYSSVRVLESCFPDWRERNETPTCQDGLGERQLKLYFFDSKNESTLPHGGSMVKVATLPLVGSVPVLQETSRYMRPVT